MTGMFQRVCIANRGEIAVRVMRTCRTLGIATHALYSDADAGALHVRSADGATRIGAAPVAESYLNAEAVLDAAVAARCDAVHPGYGLLSENPAFARACAQRGLTFIGPDPLHIEQMGDKDRARALMRALGIPPIPGSAAILPDDDVDGIAAQVGYPLIVKASRGGGGIGMAVAREPDQLARALRPRPLYRFPCLRIAGDLPGAADPRRAPRGGAAARRRRRRRSPPGRTRVLRAATPPEGD